jgi:hypothetical protein
VVWSVTTAPHGGSHSRCAIPAPCIPASASHADTRAICSAKGTPSCPGTQYKNGVHEARGFGWMPLRSPHTPHGQTAGVQSPLSSQVCASRDWPVRGVARLHWSHVCVAIKQWSGIELGVALTQSEAPRHRTLSLACSCRPCCATTPQLCTHLASARPMHAAAPPAVCMCMQGRISN